MTDKLIDTFTLRKTKHLYMCFFYMCVSPQQNQVLVISLTASKCVLRVLVKTEGGHSKLEIEMLKRVTLFGS